MWKVVFLVCVACLFAIVSPEPQASFAASAASSATSCGAGAGCSRRPQSAAATSAAAASGSSCVGGRCGNTPQQCTGPNEIFDACPAACPPQQCGVDPALVLCAPTTECKPGCRCVDDYVRNENNQCIPRDSCPKQGCNGDPNASPGCGVNCGRTCDTYDKGPQTCIQACEENGCACNKGYVFDGSQGKCVLPQNCTQQCTGPNEIFDACPAACPPQQCRVDPALVLCAPTTECKPGCRCVDDYVRNENNQCIPRDSCPKQGCNGDPNASPGCGVNCGRTCDTYDKEPQSCIQACEENGCDCNKDYVFDDSQGKCVLPQNCSCNGDPNATPGCGVNCGRTCDTYNKGPQSCILVCYENACDCKKDYVFDNNQGRCVLPQDCTKPGCGGDPNAHPGCGVNCGRTCSTYDKGPGVCPLYCKEGGCDCNDGYVFDPAVQKCVLPENCTPQCGLNEILSNCSNGGCGPFTCSDLGSPVKCVRPQKCEVGCVCQNTYVRNANGTCVPKDQCTGSCGRDPNAVPGCGVNCGRTCSTYKSKNPICPRICKANGCDCKPGYVFDPNVNKCVLPRYCTPTCGPNEKYCRCCQRCTCQKGFTYAQTSAGTCVRN